MNHLKKTTLMFSLSISMTGIVHAQSNIEIDQLRAEVKALKVLIEQYTQTQQVHTQVSNTAIAQSQSNSAQTHKFSGLASTVAGSEVKFYGNIRMDTQFQAEGGAAARSYNQINSVPLQGMNERSDEFKSTLSATRLGLDFKTPTQAKEVTAKLEVDFFGGANFDNLRIRHAYINYGNWLLGQTWSNFAVPDYMPESIDALGFVGGAVKRTAQVRYSHRFNPETHLISSIEDPKDTSINIRMPAFTTRLNHKLSDTLALSGRLMAHEKRIDQDEKWAWGVGLGAKYDLLPNTFIKADYYHVKGDSSFVSWANAGVVVQNNQIVAQNEFDSITVGVTQQFNDKLRGTLGYGLMKFDQDQDYINASLNPTAINRDLWQAWANMFYSPTKPISLGVEYVYGEREAFGVAPNGSTKGEDNRINAMAIYNF